MRILSWNCHGLGNAAAVRALLDVLKRQNPDVVFLSETHLEVYPEECLKRRIKMDFKIVQASDGRRGGIILFWRKEVIIHQVKAEPNFIDVRIEDGPNKIWRFTGMYGEFKWEEKYKTWDRMRSIHQNNNLPWVVMGDLNEILFDYEKEGGRQRPPRYIQDFHRALDDCDLSDLGYVGDIYTWHRGNMRSRLDRAVGNLTWNQMYLDAAVIHLEYNHSDHRPLLLDTEYYAAQNPVQNKGQRNFEAKWFREENFGEIVKDEWEAAVGATSPIDVLQRLKTMHSGLHAWDQRVLRRPKRRLREAQRDLENVMRGPINQETDRRKHEISNLIEKLLEQEEIKWKQRSRANWLHHGDRNTSYFHSYATARKRRNTIKKLKDATRDFVEGNDLNPVILNYFSNMFSTENNIVQPDFLEKIIPKVTQQMNEDLIAPFTGEDVKNAAFSIGDLKAPGPDGLHALFYKKILALGRS
jgi:hypothetical protein